MAISQILAREINFHYEWNKVVAEQITGASSYINSMTGINLYENFVSAEQITGASSYINSMTGINLYENFRYQLRQIDRCIHHNINSMTGINLYENLITSTSITGGTENINSIVVSSSLFIPTTSSGVTGTIGVEACIFLRMTTNYIFIMGLVLFGFNYLRNYLSLLLEVHFQSKKEIQK